VNIVRYLVWLNENLTVSGRWVSRPLEMGSAECILSRPAHSGLRQAVAIVFGV
jgi:hypothetical protein